jgi:hypothetical protein
MENRNTICAVNNMIQYLDQRDIKSIEHLIKNENFNVNHKSFVLMKSNKFQYQPLLFYFVHTLTTEPSVFYGVYRVDFEIIKLIVDCKADINYVSEGFNVLSLICQHAWNYTVNEVVQLLLDNKIDANNSLLNYPVINYAANRHNFGCVELLLKNSVPIDETVFTSYTGHFNFLNMNMTKLLFDHMPEENTWFTKKEFEELYCKFKKIDYDKSELKDCYTHKIFDVSYSTFLLHLCNMGCLKLFKQLINRRATIDLERRHDHISIYTDQHIWKIVRYDLTLFKVVLLNIHLCRDNNLNNYIEIAKILIDNGADTIKRIQSVNPVESIETYVVERKHIINDNLLLYLPNVLVNMVCSYIP